LEIWLSPSQWCNEAFVPLTHESVPKAWIVGPEELEVLVYQPFSAHSGGHVVMACIGNGWQGARIPKPENFGGFVAIMDREEIETTILNQTLATWEQPRFVQEEMNQGIWKAAKVVVPLNASILNFLLGYDRTVPIYATVGMARESLDSQRVWSVVFVQEGRKMIQTCREADNITYDQLYSEGKIRQIAGPTSQIEDPIVWRIQGSLYSFVKPKLKYGKMIRGLLFQIDSGKP
jgi:hypothetical protein